MQKLLLPLAFLATAPLVAQHAAPAAAYGAVSGTITCVDTNLPARLTDVTLQPVSDPAAKADKTPRPDDAPFQMLQIHRSHLDGTFFIPRVAPGRYYVVAVKPGYLSPVAQYSLDEVEHPTPAMRKTLEETVPTVTVAANQTVSIDIRLIRAASISGTIRWDDGTPVPELRLRFKRKDKEGKWVDTNLGTHGSPTTDDLGHFHAAGLPADEYQISTNLFVDEHFTDGIFGGSGSSSSSTKESIDVYWGDTFFRKDAKTVKIGDGEDVTADLTIPVSKLHTLSGTLVDARSGHVINAGTINFSTPDTAEAKGQSIVTATVDTDEPTFRIDFIPEGDYVVRITDARDVTREEIPLCPRCVGTRQFKETVLKRYGPYEAPFTVQNDAQGITFPIPAAKAGAAAPEQ